MSAAIGGGIISNSLTRRKYVHHDGGESSVLLIGKSQQNMHNKHVIGQSQNNQSNLIVNNNPKPASLIISQHLQKTNPELVKSVLNHSNSCYYKSELLDTNLRGCDFIIDNQIGVLYASIIHLRANPTYLNSRLEIVKKTKERTTNNSATVVGVPPIVGNRNSSLNPGSNPGNMTTNSVTSNSATSNSSTNSSALRSCFLFLVFDDKDFTGHALDSFLQNVHLITLWTPFTLYCVHTMQDFSCCLGELALVRNKAFSDNYLKGYLNRGDGKKFGAFWKKFGKGKGKGGKNANSKKEKPEDKSSTVKNVAVSSTPLAARKGVVSPPPEARKGASPTPPPNVSDATRIKLRRQDIIAPIPGILDRDVVMAEIERQNSEAMIKYKPNESDKPVPLSSEKNHVIHLSSDSEDAIGVMDENIDGKQDQIENVDGKQDQIENVDGKQDQIENLDGKQDQIENVDGKQDQIEEETRPDGKQIEDETDNSDIPPKESEYLEYIQEHEEVISREVDLLAYCMSRGDAYSLVDYFGSLSSLFTATKEELKRVPGFGPKKIERFWDCFHCKILE